MMKEKIRTKLEKVIKTSNEECTVGIHQFSEMIEEFLENDEDFNTAGYTFEIAYEEYAPMFAVVYDGSGEEIWHVETFGPAEDAKYELVEI